MRGKDRGAPALYCYQTDQNGSDVLGVLEGAAATINPLFAAMDGTKTEEGG